MPKPTLVFAALLLALGLGAFALSGSRTALLPAYFGGALAVLAGLALAFAGARRHLMHVAAVIALLGALAPAAALAIRATQMSPLALGAECRAAGDDDPLVRRCTQGSHRGLKSAPLARDALAGVG